MAEWPRTREQLNMTNINVENSGMLGNLNIKAPSQDDRAPGGVIMTGGDMRHAVKTMFMGNELPVGKTRSGAIYEVKANLTYLSTALRNTVSAYVEGAPLRPINAHVLVKVSHIKPHMQWNVWLQQQVREALMHRALYVKTYNTGCGYVPPFYFAGLDMRTGLYYTVMQRPKGRIATVEHVIRDGNFGMKQYRAVEAAVGHIWHAGAMLTDTSAGNMLLVDKGSGGAAIVDYDSSIVYPPHIRDTLRTQIDATWSARARSKCRHIQNSSEADLVQDWHHILRNPDDVARLKNLTVRVYSRRTWYPDVTMLRILFDIARERDALTKLTAQKKRALFKPSKRFFSGLRGDSNFSFPDIKARRIGALPEEVKSTWRRRRHTSSSTKKHKVVRNSSNDMVLRQELLNKLRGVETLRAPQSVSRNVYRAGPNGGVVVERAVNRGTRNVNTYVNNASAPAIPNNIARLVNIRQSPFDRTIPVNANQNRNKNKTNNTNNAKKRTFGSPPTMEEYRDYPSLSADHREHIIDEEMKRVQRRAYYKSFVQRLKGKNDGGTNLLNDGIDRFVLGGQQLFKKLQTADKKMARREHADTIAEKIMREVVGEALTARIPYDQSRDREILRIIAKRMSWKDWAFGWMNSVLNRSNGK